MAARGSRGMAGRMAIGLSVATALGAVACGSSGGEGGLPGTTANVPQQRSAFCSDVARYVEVLDDYGRIFTENQLTIGQLKADVDKLSAAEADVKASAGKLADAVEATNKAAATTTSGTGLPATTTTIKILSAKTPDEHLAAISRAERSFDDALADAQPGAPVSEAAAEINAAAFGVEQAYVALFVDAGCLKEDAEAARAVSQYVAALQQDLTTAGTYTGAVDGLYGPATVTAVKAVQASAGLPQTGVVDPDTEATLARLVAAKGTQQTLNIAALQGALKTGGYYTGAIDGKWSDEVETALKAYQTAQKLPPTGKVDPATLDALLKGGTGGSSATTSTTKAAATPTTMAAATTTTKPA
jgi:peptidoglycan hydrolase-like protein with peptidoglycan-binding domain